MIDIRQLCTWPGKCLMLHLQNTEVSFTFTFYVDEFRWCDQHFHGITMAKQRMRMILIHLLKDCFRYYYVIPTIPTPSFFLPTARHLFCQVNSLGTWLKENEHTLNREKTNKIYKIKQHVIIMLSLTIQKREKKHNK